LTGAVQQIGGAMDTLVGSSLDFEKQQQDMKTILKGNAAATDALVKSVSVSTALSALTDVKAADLKKL
jgi:hypothetical protein